MRIITVKEFLREMIKDWDSIDVVFFNYKTKHLESHWISKDSIRYDEKEKRIHFEDLMKFMPHSMPIIEPIMVDKKQVWNGEITEYIMNLNNDEDIIFEALECF